MALPVKEATAMLPKVSQTTLPVYKPSISNLYLKMLVYGPPGVGKTTLLGSAQDCEAMFPCLFGNLEGGVLSLIDMPNPPDVYDVGGDIMNFEELYRFLSQEDHPYKSLCLDSLSELQRLHREQLVGMRALAGKREDRFDVQRKDWGDNMSYILYWIRKFRDLPMHVLASCHSESKEKPEGGERVYPLLNKALVEPMCGIFDVVGYLFTSSVDPDDEEAPTERKILLEPRTINDIEFYAKDRSPQGRIGRVVKNPTMPLIWQRIQRRKMAAHKTTQAPEKAKDVASVRRQKRIAAAGDN